MTPCLLPRPWPAAWCGLLLPLLSLWPALAAAADVPQRADPLDARAAVPATPYHSPFSQYRRLDTHPPLPWREANDQVARIGGWRAYAREAHGEQASDRGPAPPPSPGRTPAAPSATPRPMPRRGTPMRRHKHRRHAATPGSPSALACPGQPGWPWPLALLATAAVLSGCASLDPDAGFSAVQQRARSQLGKDLLWARSEADLGLVAQRVGALLAQPLTVDAAVQVALLNNRGLQAELQDLGITEAEVVQAAQLPNPGFSLGRSRRGDEVERERGLHVDMARLLSLPWARPLASARLAQTQARLSMALLTLAGDTRSAYYQALAADERLRYLQQVMQAAEASAELARRMEQVGNFSTLQRAREQRFYAEATLQFARAQQAQRSSRERLTRLLGLWGEQASFDLPERLPDLPTAPLDQPAIEQQAMASRRDVQAARLAAEQTAQQLGLTRQTRFINVLDLGLLQTRSSEAPTQRGWEIRLELPLFDWGQARVARAEAVYMQALHRAAETAVNARSEVREAYGNYRLAHDIARHHREALVPLSQQIADENLLRYNGMLIGVFELLADARSQINTVNSAIEALRDFWIAQAALEMALIGPARPGAGLPGSPAQAPAPDAAAH